MQSTCSMQTWKELEHFLSVAGGTRLHKITSAIGVIDGKEYVDYIRSNVDLSKRMGLQTAYTQWHTLRQRTYLATGYKPTEQSL